MNFGGAQLQRNLHINASSQPSDRKFCLAEAKNAVKMIYGVDRESFGTASSSSSSSLFISGIGNRPKKS